MIHFDAWIVQFKKANFNSCFWFPKVGGIGDVYNHPIGNKKPLLYQMKVGVFFLFSGVFWGCARPSFFQLSSWQ